MALIQCPQCGNNISEYGETCPHCGYALQKEQTRRRSRKVYLILTATLFTAALAFAITMFAARRGTKATAANQATTPPYLDLSGMPTVEVPQAPTVSFSLPASPVRTYTKDQQRVRELAEQSPLSNTEVMSRLRQQGMSLLDALYAMAGCGVNWNNQAVRRALVMLDADAHHTRETLTAQLIQAGFSEEQAQYGAEHCGRVWE